MSHLMDNASIHFDIIFSPALEGCFCNYTFIPNELISNEKMCMEYLETDILLLLKWYSEGNIFLKWSYALDARFTRLNADGEAEFKNAGFTSSDCAFDNTDASKLPEKFDEMRNSIISRIDKYSKEGSGWILAEITSFKLSLYRFRLNYGGCKTDIPIELATKQCVINIACTNCFKWSILAALHHHEVNHKNMIASYREWENDYNFPADKITTAQNVAEFVKNNKLAVYTHWYTNGLAECTFRPPRAMVTTCPHIHLLLVNNHWIAITKLSRLYRTRLNSYFELCDCC